MTAQLAPHFSWPGYRPRLRPVRHSEVGQGHTVGMEQAQHVMVGAHQERNGVRIRGVVGQEGGVHVPVWRDQRQASDLVVQFHGYVAYRRFGGEQPVRVRQRLRLESVHHRKLPRKDVEKNYRRGPG